MIDCKTVVKIQRNIKGCVLRNAQRNFKTPVFPVFLPEKKHEFQNLGTVTKRMHQICYVVQICSSSLP